MSLLAEVQFGREVLGNLELAESREWLVTNGIGGYASGTAAGTSTRRYHGMLIAALEPPAGRNLLVAGLDETVRHAGREFPLATNRWLSGAVAKRTEAACKLIAALNDRESWPEPYRSAI